MRIKKVSTQVFAGLQNKSLEFKDGLNVVYGDNEAGKSSFINLIDQMLFKDAKVNKKNIEDINFSNSFFPSDLKTGATSNNAKGCLEFSSKGEDFTLNKTWSTTNPATELQGITGLEVDSDKIQEQIMGILGHSRNIVESAIITSQSDASDRLAALLDDASATSNDLSRVLTELYSSAGTVNLEDFIEEVNDKIKELADRWDEGADTVELTGNKFYKSYGLIGSKYVEREELREKLKEAEDKEEKYNRAALSCEDALKKKNEAEKTYNEFQKHYSVIKNGSSNKQNLETSRNTHETLKKALEVWPENEKNLETAEHLIEAIEINRAIKEEQDLNELKKVIKDSEEKISKIACAEDSDVKELKEREKKINTLQNSLKGPELELDINMLNGHDADITYISSGEKVSPAGGRVVINEAVRISIPDVMEMTVASKGCDIDKVSEELKKEEASYKADCKKYNVSSSEELETVVKNRRIFEEELEKAKNKLEALLNGRTEDDITKLASDAKLKPRTAETQIETDTNALLGMTVESSERLVRLETFKGTLSSKLAELKAEYTDKKFLQDKIDEAEDLVNKNQAEVDKLKSIPSEFETAVSDPDAFRLDLENMAKSCEENYSRAKDEETKVEQELNREEGKGSIQKKIDNTTEELESLKDQLKRWEKIRDKYSEIKALKTSNPLDSLYKSFVDYLGVLTNNKVSSDFAEGEKLNVTLYANNDHIVDMKKLSDGTREAVALAFRLAVFDELYKDEDSFCIFDDALINMDINRETAAVELLKKFAEHHQVIYFTCKKDMQTKLGGNQISL